MKTKKLNVAAAVLPLVVGVAMAGSAFAGSYSSSLGTIVPLMQAGNLPDSPAARVDPNVSTSPYSGVVSINIRYNGLSFICSGTLVSKRDVVSAGHCVDTDGNGHVIDLTKPGNDVRVVFNSQPTFVASRDLITADHVYMNPDYQGFGNCPYATTTDFCVNDDVSVIHMNKDAPDTAKIYRIYDGPEITTGQLDTMVGYGLSGDGVNGYTVNPSFFVKRGGQNLMDLFDVNDEQHFLGGPKEVWYADFDGNGQNTFCDNPTIIFPPVCTASLANNVETMLGGGDSGGPSFYNFEGENLLMGNNTFSGNLFAAPTGKFGDYSGGILLQSYIPWLEEVTNHAIQVVPEPSTYALLLLALGLMGMGSRRRKVS